MFARGTAVISAAAICAGAFALMTQPSASEGTQAVTAKIQDRHPAYMDNIEPATFTLRQAKPEGARVPQTVDSAAKGDLASAAPNCGNQTWPLIDTTCLSASDGAPVRVEVRTVKVENDLAHATSVVTRTGETVTAAR